MAARAFHITVGTGPQGAQTGVNQFGADLGHDLRIVKAALLYADKVTLCSPATSLIMGILAARNLTLLQQIGLMEQLAPMLVPGDKDRLLVGLAVFRGIAKKLFMTPEEAKFFREFRQLFVGNWRNVQYVLDEMRTATGADQLIDIMQSGIVELHPLSLEDAVDFMTNDFVQAIMTAVSSGETYPLFDEHVCGLVRAGINENLIEVSPARIARSKHTALAANLLERLPLFDLASVDEILDIRRALEAPLVRFRSAVIHFSERVKTASWDADFPLEADEVFRRDVEPAVSAIEAELSSNPYLLELSSKVFGRTATPVGGTVLTMALSTMTELPVLAAAAFGLAAAGAANAAEAYWEWRRKQQQIERTNQVFFYYAASKRLQAG